MIMKSPSPEIPADFTGGFIKISTKGTPEKNQYMLSYGVSVNDRDSFQGISNTIREVQPIGLDLTMGCEW